MKFLLVFQKHVRDDIYEAYSWYENQRKGLGERFLKELDRVFNRLKKSPAVHQMIFKDVRRTLLKRFPYTVFYQIATKRVEIVAVQFSRRDPAIWQSRVST